jgi:hypothetical protein
MINKLSNLEPAAKMLAATGLSQSFSFCMERKYIENICDTKSEGIFHLDAVPNTNLEEGTWIEIKQVGKPIDNSSENCFTAIQKILYSCFLPKETQLLFLITWDGTENKLYLGVRGVSEDIRSKSLVKSLNEFMKGAWPGLQTEIVKESASSLAQFKKDVAEEQYEYIYALTGIPSMESQYKSVYPATMDKLMAGMNKSKKYAYFVVADPIENSDAEFMLYQCREMNGQAESLKSMNVTEGLSQGTSQSLSKTLTTSHSTSHGESVSKKDFSKFGKTAMAATGIGVAASFFPAAEAIVDGVADVTGQLTTAALGLLGGSMIGGAISNAMPQKTVSDTTTEGKSESDSIQQGTSETNSKSISANVVNKHIEAVSEKLFYHSQRLETGESNRTFGRWESILWQTKSLTLKVGLCN